ncbi:uncharacterized protein LOC117177782 [Belonocnema kinseyi]|uniref:uncharacterized protein LOC117177782 n=1 Tax=Belonocnema kinseyi TaxID=2817044 RepID=UPI00143D4AEE|nr:uncharacterized protein LOC117177782 [Belonocnema kinseyi]XP_033224710.1 uncharacterized protein LOC117177782 [Belonocnema kinseyi]
MPFKRKRILKQDDLSDEDFVKPRRSSLQVNLSYISNLTDSGHGSSRRIDETLNDVPSTNNLPVTGTRRTRKNLPSKESEPLKKRKRNLSKIIENQNDVNNEEQVLNDSCSLLRDAILRKTREIFDQGNELAIKTSRVLEEGSKMIRSVEDELSKTLNLDTDSRSVILEKDSRSVIIEKSITSRSVVLDSEPTSSSIQLENDSDPGSKTPESEKDARAHDESEKPKPPTKTLKSMILEMSTNTRSTLLERMKESNLISQTSKDSKSTTDKSLTPPGKDQNCRSPSVRVALREDQQIIMSGKNKNADPVRINVMNSSPVSRRSDQSDQFVTPKKSRVSDASNENQIFPKKRLFSDENIPEHRTPEHNFLEPKTLLQKSFLESPKPLNVFTSPVLSGSTRKHPRLSLRRAQITQNENEKGAKIKDSSLMKETLNITGRNSSPGFPLTCSSFIDNRNQIRNPDILNFPGRGTNESACMEMTTIPNILPISVRGLPCDKESSDKPLKESFKDSQDKRVVSMELTEVEGNILDVIHPQGVNPQLEEAPSCILEDTEIQDVTVKTKRTSLNVNTSMDPTEGKKSEETVCLSSSCDSSKRPKQTQQSWCAIRSSLKVNTSLDYLPKYTRKKLTVSEIATGKSSRKIGTVEENPVSDEGNAAVRDSDPVGPNSDRRKSSTTGNRSCTVPAKSNTMSDQRNAVFIRRSAVSVESIPGSDKPDSVQNKSDNLPNKSNSVIMNSLSESCSSESLENVSLVQRLKGLFVKPSTSAKKIRTSRSSRSMNSTKDTTGETSCVEGTPLPISRSFLWKSQIKQNTFASNLNFNVSEKSNETNFSAKTNASVENVGPNPKQLRKPKVTGRHPALSNYGSEATQPPNESLEKITTTESNKSSKAEDSSPDNSKKPRKKKLYPLRGRSQQLSLSPARSLTPSPKRIVFPKRRKNKKWLKMQNTQRTQMSLRAQKTQKTQKPANDLESSESSAESGEDMSANHQTQNLTKRKKNRKVLRKKIVIKKIASSGAVTETERNKVKFQECENSEGGRSSFNDFEPKKKVEKNKKISKRIIVTTGLSNEDKSLVKSVVKQLGKAEMELNVSRKTTHVVSTGVRTINLLKGIIRGCWLVSLEWVLKSLENGEWIHPEPYEMAHFSAAVQENRRDRQLFGKAFVPELFSTCGKIYVENGTNPVPSSLKELIKTAGGQVTEDPTISEVVVGSEGLKEIWVLDSITTGVLQPADNYRRK